MLLTYRQHLFKRAWKLDLAGGHRNNSDRILFADKYCNAVSYYAMIKWSQAGSGFRSASDVSTPVSNSIVPDRYHERRLATVESNKLVKDLDATIPSNSCKAIGLYLVEERDSKDAGREVSMGRVGDPAANMALAVIFRHAAEFMFPLLNRLPDDHEFHTEYVASESLGLSPLVRRERK